MTASDVQGFDAVDPEDGRSAPIVRPARPWMLHGPALKRVRDLTVRLIAMDDVREDRLRAALERLANGSLGGREVYSEVASRVDL